jgi:hypothetical protein
MHRNGCTARSRSIKPEFPVRHLGQHELYIQPPPGGALFSHLFVPSDCGAPRRATLPPPGTEGSGGASFQAISHTHLRPPPSFDLLAHSLRRPVRSAPPAPRAAAPYPEQPPRTDKSDLASSVFKLQILFAFSVISVEVKLAPYRFSRGEIDTSSLTGSLSAVRTQLQSFVALAQPAQAYHQV